MLVSLWGGYVVVQPSYPLCRIGLLDSTGWLSQVVRGFDPTDVSSCWGWVQQERLQWMSSLQCSWLWVAVRKTTCRARVKIMARRWRMTSWLARSTRALFLRVRCVWHREFRIDRSARPKYDIASDAPVVLVGNNSTHESIITKIWVLPLSSAGKWPMWSIWRLSNGL